MAAGQHWVYRLQGRRKCWFQVAEGTATVKKPVRHRAAKARVATSGENETTGRRPKAVVDAHPELRGSAPAETSQTTPPAIRVVDAGPVLATGITTRVPPAPFAERVDDQVEPDRSMPRHVDVEALLAAAPAASDVVGASAPSATLVALPIAEPGYDGRRWTWLGVLLMALGLVSILSSSRTLRDIRAAAPTDAIFRFVKRSYRTIRDLSETTASGVTGR
jgi:hypothetical protein